MTTENRQIYLSTKDGQVHGPFSADTIQDMKKTGVYQQYAWVWEESQGQWQPTAAPPTAPPAPPSRSEEKVKSEEKAKSQEKAESQAQKTKSQEKAPEPKVLPSAQHDHLLVVCHDYRNIASGKVLQTTPDGCLFETEQPQASLPPFRSGAVVWLNILDSRSGKSENIKTTVLEAGRAPAGARFKLKWEKIPDSLK